LSTPFSKPVEKFLKRIEKDRTFFNYIDVDPDKVLEIAIERAKNILFDAVDIIDLRTNSDVIFSNYSKDLEIFNFDLTTEEVFLVSCFMYQVYMDRDIAKLKHLNVNYTPSDLRVLDPSNARKTFMDMYDYICEQNDKYIDKYKSKDRLTGELKGIDYSSYDEDE
jgi:hypothetical protein